MKQSEVIDEGFKDFIAGALNGAGMDQTKNLYTAHMNTTPAAAPQQQQYGGPTNTSADSRDDEFDDGQAGDTSAQTQPTSAAEKDPEFIRQIKGLVGIHLDDGRLTKQDLNTFMQMVGRAMSKLPDTLADGSEPIHIRHIKQQVNRDIVAALPADKRAAKKSLKTFIATLEQMIKRMRD